jgi:hypothetical protein
MRAAVKYLRAVEFAAEMYRALAEKLPRGFDFEVSVDETETPTSPLEHFFVVQELRRREVEIASIAPRFSGSLEKAVDYRGDLEVFRRDLRAHVAIARALGGYRISLHSGSDKFSLYPVFAKEADGLFHVKTAGTSYLVALEVIAKRVPDLFREIYKFSLARFPEDRPTTSPPTSPPFPLPMRCPPENFPSSSPSQTCGKSYTWPTVRSCVVRWGRS